MSSTDLTFQSPKCKASKHKAIAGFTLIEVLVASAILALMALISWRGLDGMSKAQVALQTRSDANQTWQVGLAQWRTDLDNMVTLQIPQRSIGTGVCCASPGSIHKTHKRACK
jgi:prepilin-type N-terminal cleavage/methylation domain-containing protein